jgi:hypothetical protein
LPEQRKLTRDAQFAQSKFGAKHGWTPMTVAPRLDWARVAALVTASYRLVAGKRMPAARATQARLNQLQRQLLLAHVAQHVEARWQ